MSTGVGNYKTLKPWMRGPFELLRHAEEHRVKGTDFDRRMALISYDNAIEVSISTHLGLKPVQRRGVEYAGDKIQKWLHHFDTKIAFFFETFAPAEKPPAGATREEVIFYHDLRNELYHSGNGLVPEEYAVLGARVAAIWVFSVLFGITLADLERELPGVEQVPDVVAARRGTEIPIQKVNLSHTPTLPDGNEMADTARNIAKVLAPTEPGDAAKVDVLAASVWNDSDKVSGRTALLRAWTRLEALLRHRFPDVSGIQEAWRKARAEGVPKEFEAIFQRAHRVSVNLSHSLPTGLSHERMRELAGHVDGISRWIELTTK